MNNTLRNILAGIGGGFIGGLINMAIIMASGKIIPPPPGADLTTAEGLTAAMPLMGPQHFLMPFLAHALGTLTGALIAAMFAATHKMRVAMVVGIFFLVGGIMAARMIPAPTWFIVLDLLVAYIPMAYIGGKLGSGKM
ncbi:MAG TPA: hypothetical protein PLW44_07335 [Chitinophagales bacterium]|nr:hypothetical protein [Chitinophagales bacterium]